MLIEQLRGAMGRQETRVAAAGGIESIVSLATTPFSGPIAAGASVQGPLVLLGGTDLSHVAPADLGLFFLDTASVGNFNGFHDRKSACGLCSRSLANSAGVPPDSLCLGSRCN